MFVTVTLLVLYSRYLCCFVFSIECHVCFLACFLCYLLKHAFFANIVRFKAYTGPKHCSWALRVVCALACGTRGLLLHGVSREHWMAVGHVVCRTRPRCMHAQGSSMSVDGPEMLKEDGGEACGPRVQ